MADVGTTIHGADEIGRKYGRLTDDLLAFIGPAMLAALSNIKDAVAPYPPASEANQPKHGSWGPYYERGVGSAYKRKTDGGITQYHNSERLGANWTMQAKTGPYSSEGTLGNRASYSQYVHDADNQPDYHAERGWKTAQESIEKERPGIVRLFDRVVAEVLRRWNMV